MNLCECGYGQIVKKGKDLFTLLTLYKKGKGKIHKYVKKT